MACNIRYSENDSPIGVYDNQGNPSKLFNQIFSNPHLSFQEALDSYVNISELEQEPNLLYQTEVGQFNNFADALKSISQGDISAGVEIDGKFKLLFKINSDTNINTYNGLINNLIKSDLIKGETEVDVDGKKLFNPVGNSEYKTAVTSDLAITTARSSVGYKAHRNQAGQLYFDQTLIGKREILNENEQPEIISEQDLDNKSWSTLKRTTSDPVGILAERAYKENNRVYGDTTPLEEIEIIPENILQERLLGLLNKMGITTASLESYEKRFGEKPSAQALADISNQIVAFKNNEITQEDLSEEVSHFIIEATPAEEIENLLRNIHKTSEWSQYEQSYREIYSSQYPSNEVDDVVRKEVLGKVLANSLQDNFAQNKASETQNSIIGRIRELFNSFFNKINSFFKPSYQVELDNYTKAAYNNLMANSLYEQLDTEQLDGKKYVYYSLSQAGVPEQYRELTKAIDHLSNQQYQLQKKYTAPASQNELKEAKESLLKAIEEKEEEIQDKLKLKALLNIATVSNAQLNYLNRALDKDSKNGYHFAQEESSVYQNFITKMEPLLAQLSNKLNPKNRAEKQIKEKIDSALKKSSELKGKVPANTTQTVVNLVERIIQKNNVTGDEATRLRKQLTDVLTTAQADTSFFHSHLGQLVHSRNILLNLAGDTIAKTVTDQRKYYLPQIKAFLNKLEASKFNPRNLKNLIDKDGYIQHEIDNGKLEKLDREVKTRIYNEITEANISADEFNDSLTDSLSVDDKNNFNKAFNEERKSRLESFFTKEHLEKLENTFIEINGNKIYKKDLPKVALEYDQYYRGQLTQIRINNNGINSESDKYEIEELNKQRLLDSNPRNPDGSLKNGLREYYNEELQQYVVEIDNTTITSDEDIVEANKIYGLQMINLLNRKFYEGSERSSEIPQAFTEKLKEFETEQEKWDFVQYNAYIGFQDEYWDNFDNNTSFAERLTSAKDGENNEEIDELLEDIRRQQQIISNILKANRVFNQPSETNVSKMTDTETSSVKDAAIQLESLYQKANSYLEETEREEPFSETRLNEAFRKDLEDEGINTTDGIINHIIKHVTPKNKSAIEKAQKVVDRISRGQEVFIDKSLQNVFTEEMSESEANDALLEFAQSKLLPYYKRTEPIGYSQEREKLLFGIENNTEGTVEDFIKNSEFTKISPSYSFYNQNENINLKWVENRDAKRPQYTQEFLSKVRNEEYFNKFGINSEGIATKNLDEWNARQALLELQDWTIENYNLTGRHNRYQLPQMHKSNVRRLSEFLGGLNFSNLREGLQEMVNFRQDEGQLGQDESGNQVSNSAQLLSIPIYGVRKAKNQNDITDELLHSYSWMASQSALYKARRENISNMLAIQDAVLNADYSNKQATATNTYKMFKSFINSSFYGVNETFSYKIGLFGKTIDLGKLARVFNGWVRSVALTSATVPITSLFQAKIQRAVESRVGEITNPIAMKLAMKEFNKTAGASAAEIMNMNSKAKLNVLGEAYGLYDLINTRFENSNYNKATRFALGVTSGIHSLGNFPALPTVMYSILNDYRYYKGNIISYNQYLRQNAGQNKKQLKEDWQKLELFYNDISTENGVQTYKKESIAKKTGWTEEELDSRLDLLHEAITNRIGAATQRIDSQIPDSQKSIAARDARASFFLMFQNWFTLQLQYKLKSYSYDTAADLYTEGTLITTAKFLQDMLMNIKDFKKVYRETIADPVKKRNLKRTAIELAVANALAMVAISLANFVDDDDDPEYALSFLDYFTTRVSSEQIGSTVALPKQLGNIIESPLAAADRFYDLFNITDVFTGEPAKNFDGSVREKWFSKNLPIIKDYYRLRDIKKSQDTYQYYNESVYDYAVLGYLFDENSEE